MYTAMDVSTYLLTPYNATTAYLNIHERCTRHCMPIFTLTYIRYRSSAPGLYLTLRTYLSI